MVLDEADEMLDMGFAEDLEAIFDQTPDDCQTVLFSATLPPRIDSIARHHLRNPARIRIVEQISEAGEDPKVRHSAYIVARAHKAAALGRILDVEAPAAALVFCRTREVVDSLTETLNGRGYRAEALHGGMSQEQRDRVMTRLRHGSADLIVATDVAARGLDIEQLSHVVNYDVPSSVDSYVHRIGRVGRAGREGVAVTLAEPREHRMLKTIERATRHRIAIEQVPTVADLQARRLDLTRGGDPGQYRRGGPGPVPGGGGIAFRRVRRGRDRLGSREARSPLARRTRRGRGGYTAAPLGHVGSAPGYPAVCVQVPERSAQVSRKERRASTSRWAVNRAPDHRTSSEP